jgi:hypothetical protein
MPLKQTREGKGQNMKRIGMAGLCLMVMVAFSAIAASSAFAAEYGVCVKASKVEKEYTGEYTEKNCQNESATASGKYEWVPGPGPEPKYTGKTGVVTLTGAAGAIECKKSVSTGEITGPKSDTDVFTFSQCTTKGAPCTTVRLNGKGQWEEVGTVGDIETLKLNTTLIGHGEAFEQLGPDGEPEKLVEPAEGEIWTLFTSSEESGPYKGLWAAYNCREVARIFTGGELAGVTTENLTTTFEEGKGLQDLFGEAEVDDNPPLVPIGRGTAKATDKAKGAKNTEVHQYTFTSVCYTRTTALAQLEGEEKTLLELWNEAMAEIPPNNKQIANLYAKLLAKQDQVNRMIAELVKAGCNK